jgi:hypothetical protein
MVFGFCGAPPAFALKSPIYSYYNWDRLSILNDTKTVLRYVKPNPSDDFYRSILFRASLIHPRR